MKREQARSGVKKKADGPNSRSLEKEGDSKKRSLLNKKGRSLSPSNVAKSAGTVKSSTSFRNGFLPQTVLGDFSSAEKFSRSPYMNSINDLREELLKTKRIHSMALRENSIIRTKLKIAEKDSKRKEKEIEALLSSDQQNASKYEERLQLNSLRKKVLGLERSLRDKSEENEKLLNDRNVARAAETRHLAGKLESECNRLKNHLSQSIPEGEFLREKHQYMEIIDRLTEENMHLRGIVGEYEKNSKASDQILEQVRLNGTANPDFQAALARNSRKQAGQYREALSALITQSRSKSALVGRSNSEPGRKRVERKSTPATLAHPSLGGQTSHKMSANGVSSSKPPPYTVNIPTRSKLHDVEKERERRSATSKTSHPKSGFKRSSAKNGTEERPVMELRGVGATGHKYPVAMYHDVSSDGSSQDSSQGEEDEAEVIVVGNEEGTFILSKKEQYNLGNASSSSQNEEEKEEPDLIIHVIEDKGKGNNISSASFSEGENIERLNMEYTEQDQENNHALEQVNLESILRSIQSHALRIKMLGIRRDSLKKYSK